MGIWKMTVEERTLLGSFSDSVSLSYVGDGSVGNYYLTEEDGRDALLAYAYGGVVVQMSAVDVPHDHILAVDLERGVAKVELPELALEDFDSHVNDWLREEVAA